jgi:hypothetical protein
MTYAVRPEIAWSDDVRIRLAVPTSRLRGHSRRAREKGDAVKYIIMLYGSQQDYDVLAGKPTDKPAMSPEEVAAMHAYMESIHKDLEQSGELVDGRGLTAPAHARRVQIRNGSPVVTDGPYPETQEVLVGFTIVECESFDRATEIAARFVNPDAEGEYVDVRPILEDVTDLEA